MEGVASSMSSQPESGADRCGGVREGQHRALSRPRLRSAHNSSNFQSFSGARLMRNSLTIRGPPPDFCRLTIGKGKYR